MAMPLGLYPCADGVSELWRWPAPGGTVALALGSAWNAAAAAAAGELLGSRVSHIVSVGSHRNFKAIEALMAEHGHRHIEHHFFRMSDWLRPDEQLDLKADLAETLQGHNRSPTVALAFFLYNGHTLREAYRRLLCVRPGVDPLPPYRRGLCALEAELCEGHSVCDSDNFAKHVTELMSLPDLRELAGSCPPAFHEPEEDLEDSADVAEGVEHFGLAVAVRRLAIAALLAEVDGLDDRNNGS
ncbi:unnamed protein product [Effrenium voratum]|nr:unnamed protein product [Effrenium voratum]CAJ1431002.1 unnamed protein product [Effrenium voratum]